jgi:hypothetical protein
VTVADLAARAARRIADAAFVAAVAMVATAGLLAVRIVTLEQVFNPRSFAAIGTVVVGAGVASFTWRLVAPWLPPLPRATSVLVSFVIIGAAIAGASALIFSIVDFDLAEVEVVNQGSLLKRMVHHLASGYLMLLAGWPLLFPWPLPLLAAGLSLWPLPRRSMRPPQDAAAAIVETRPERIALALRQDR